ncbi:Protein-serine O-palmitoleoyltransferase porcupine [Lamellibrachia satsuma]|nr:Protein-serine O-palmitoleoyltransferase porcupine [Lamellibrachia satsuma]
MQSTEMDWQNSPEIDSDLMYYPDEHEGEDTDDSYYDEEYGYEDEALAESKVTLTDVLDQCILPTSSQVVSTIYPLLGLCLACRVTSLLLAEVLPESMMGRRVHHLVCAGCGVYAMHLFFQHSLVYIIMLAFLTYLLLAVTSCKCRSMCGGAVSFVTAVYLLTCELLVADKAEWHRIRGSQMVLAMKVISLAFDLQGGALQDLPSIWEYCGYVFHVGSVIFGPWIGFQDYIAGPQHRRDRRILFYWVLKLAMSFLAALGSVIVSSCVMYWLFTDGMHIWFVAFRDAQSFRFSHYFICYLSQLTLTLSGLGMTKTNGDVRWDLTVSRPLHIEFPRSLVEVVTNWNVPMHYWLKTYVFKMARPMGSFMAVIATYMASSILHGLNFQLTAVLISLGVYSYVEFILRRHVSTVFSACLQAKRCKADCGHLYKYFHPYVITANLMFGSLTLFHLTYLGLMFDSSPEEHKGYDMSHTLSKWSALNFASHWVVVATYVFHLLI